LSKRFGVAVGESLHNSRRVDPNTAAVLVPDARRIPMEACVTSRIAYRQRQFRGTLPSGPSFCVGSDGRVRLKTKEIETSNSG
jgi:hypothetical protein